MPRGEFTLNIDLYERLVAIRRTIGLPTSDYLERAKNCLEQNVDLVINGEKVKISRGKTCLN